MAMHYDNATVEANVKEWLAWLEGKREPITQTTGELRNNETGGMCCLGVAVACVFKLEEKSEIDDYGFESLIGFAGKYADGRPNYVTELLDWESSDKLGLNDDSGGFKYIDISGYSTMSSLAELNDAKTLPDFSSDPILGKIGLVKGDPANFENLAKIIRAKPTDLFDENYNLD